jgi:hypothetical protein
MQCLAIASALLWVREEADAKLGSGSAQSQFLRGMKKECFGNKSVILPLFFIAKENAGKNQLTF